MKGKDLLIHFIKEHKWKYILGTMLVIFATVISSLIPKILGVITDKINEGILNSSIDKSIILRYLALMIGVSVTFFILKYFWRYFLMGTARNMECYLRDNLFQHLQTLPVSFYNKNKTGDLISYAINDIQAVRMIFGFGYEKSIEGIILITVSIFFMVSTINPILTLIALAPVPIIIFILIKLRLEIRSRFMQVQKAFSIISDKVQENISGIRVIKAFAQENEEVEAFLKHSKNRVDAHMHMVKASGLLAPITQVCFGISFMLFIIYGSELVLKGKISLGDYVAFNTYMMAIMTPIINIARIIETWQKGIASYKRLDLLFREPSQIQKEDCEAVDRIDGEILVKNLNFSYSEESNRVLKNININIRKGRTLGILGRTGSGKTTFLNLLLKLYDVEDGHIFIDGVDINNLPIELLREKIGYVPQDNFLFSTSIKQNIEFFKSDFDEEEVFEAAKLAGVYENIVGFENGFDTIIGERGVTLSGGQKQRISIARAIIKNPSILILDDSLSAVDTKTEEQILSNIKSILQKRTGIIVSHRVSTVKHADEIVFLEKGKIIERGTHEELLERKGLYYNLYRMQLEGNC